MSTYTNQSTSIELKIPALPNMELVATNAVDVIAKHMGLSEQKAAELSMALIEATINAFEHAKSDKDVFVHFIMNGDKLIVKVIDQGSGFEEADVALPDIDQKVDNESNKRGWGISLIKELVDVVQFDSNQNGTTVTMVKNLYDELKNKQQNR